MKYDTLCTYTSKDNKRVNVVGWLQKIHAHNIPRGVLVNMTPMRNPIMNIFVACVLLTGVVIIYYIPKIFRNI